MELNGFEIDKENQYNLPKDKKRSTCPKCSQYRKKDKQECLILDWDRGLGTCQHCEEVLQLHTYKRKGDSMKQYVKPPQIDSYNLPPKKIIDWFQNERGINQSTIEELNVTHGSEYMPQRNKEVDCIKFNLFMGGELINIQYRDAAKNFKMFKDAELIFYNLDSTIGHDYVVITEGYIDAMSIHQIGFKSVVSVPNGASKNLEYLDNCIGYFDDKNKIILAVDNDPKGDGLRQELIRRLGAEVCYLVDFGDCKDANDVLVKHGEDTLYQIIDNAEQVPLEGVSTLKDSEDELVDFIKNGHKKGYTIGLNNFDDIFSTYTSQYVVVTGIPSMGKSEWVDQMCVGYNMNYGWKVAYASPENKPTYLHTHKLVRKYMGRNIRTEDIDTDEWSEVKEVVDDNFFFMEFDKWDLDSVLSKGAELVKRKGIRVLVIDPYNKIRDKSSDAGRDVNRYTLDYLEKVDVFCKKHDVFAILVAHPVKMKKKEDGEFEVPTFYDIKGGGEFYDASYHGLAVHRDYRSGTVMVKVLKVKFNTLGENQAECHFNWDRDSGLFKPFTGNLLNQSLGIGSSMEETPWYDNV